MGDSEFQSKCLRKMDDVSKSGRTILFVSHNMGAIQQLCNRTILLNQGMIQLQGETKSVIDEYFKAISERSKSLSMETRHRSGDGFCIYR